MNSSVPSALGWPDREAAVPDEYHRGDVPCAFCGACRRDPGAVPPCVVWHGGSPVCLDGAQAEKAISG